MNALIGSMGGGIAILVVALLLRKKRPHWHRIIAVTKLAAGVSLIPAIAAVLGKFIELSQNAVRWLAEQTSNVAALPMILRGVANGLPWVIGLVITVWFMLDMWPRHGRADQKTAWIALLVPAAWMLLPPIASNLGLSG